MPTNSMKIGLIVLIAIFLSIMLLLNYLVSLFFMVFMLYLIVIFKYPEVGLAATVLLVSDFYSLFNPELFRLPGIFTLKDIFFIFSFMPLLLKIFVKKVNFVKTRFFGILCFILILTLIEIILTLAIRNQGVNYTIRAGRKYLYFLFLFPLVNLIDNDLKFKRFLTILVVSVILFSILMIFQEFLGSKFVIFKYASHTIEHEIAGISITRSYALGQNLALIVFLIFLFKTLLNQQHRFQNFFLASVCFFGSLYVGFSRANFIGTLMAFIFTVLVIMNKRLKSKTLIGSVIIVVVLFSLFEGIKFISFNNVPNPLYLTYRGVENGVNDFINKTGTFGFRLKDSSERIRLIRKNPILGIGFIHSESDVIKIRTLTPGITTIDSGLITLLLDFGLAGIIWLSVLTLIFYSECKKGLSVISDNNHKILIISIFTFYFSRLFSFITLSTFTTYGGIISITIALFIISYLRKEQNGLVNSSRKL